MTQTVIQKFFRSAPYLIRKIPKPFQIIDQVSPKLSQNLRQSTKQFIKGIINKDVDFIKQATSVYLGKRLTHEIQTQYKNSNMSQLFDLHKYNLDTAQSFYICPYVIFGEDFQNRIKNEEFYLHNIRPITSNRWIKFNPQLSFIERFKSYGKKQIFGFHCIYVPLKVNASEQQRRMNREFMVSFETDSTVIDPYIVDCQGALLQEWKLIPERPVQ